MKIVKQMLETQSKEGETFLYWMTCEGCLVETLEKMPSGILTAEHLLQDFNGCGDLILQILCRTSEDLSLISAVRWTKMFKTAKDIDRVRKRVTYIRQYSAIQKPPAKLISNLAEAARIKLKVERIAEKIRLEISQI
jgi:hypothetical protein